MGTWEMGGRAHRGRGGQLGTEEEEEEEGPSSVPNCDVLQSSLKEEEEEEEEGPAREGRDCNRGNQCPLRIHSLTCSNFRSSFLRGWAG